jgi:hypothetical protein
LKSRMALEDVNKLGAFLFYQILFLI